MPGFWEATDSERFSAPGGLEKGLLIYDIAVRAELCRFIYKRKISAEIRRAEKLFSKI